MGFDRAARSRAVSGDSRERGLSGGASARPIDDRAMSRALASRARAVSAREAARAFEDVITASRASSSTTREATTSRGDDRAVRGSAQRRRASASATTMRPSSGARDAPWYAAAPGGRPVTLLYAFASARDRARWETFGDFEHGGLSSCALEAGGDARDALDAVDGASDGASTSAMHDKSHREALMRSYASLVGTIDCGVPSSASSRLKRSGFAGARTKPLEKTLMNPDPAMDFDAFDAFCYRVRGDGRSYIASVRTENWMTGDSAEDVWQCAFSPPAGEWVDVVVPIESFTQTYRGRAMFDHERMSANRVVFLGLAVAGSAKTDLDERREESDGAFRLDVHSICGLRMTDDEMEAHAAARRGHENYPCGGFAASAVEALGEN